MTAASPPGVPRAIGLTPILSARHRAADLERIRAAAPGATLVNISVDGHADGPIEEVEVLLRGWLTSAAYARVLERAPDLRWVHAATSGVEKLLVPTARDRSVVITNARGVFSRPIAEYVVMMMLAVSHRLPQLLELQRERTWQPLEGAELRDLTVGIVGLGSIGQTVASIAGAFGSRVIATRRRAQAGDPGDPGGPGRPGRPGTQVEADDAVDADLPAPRLARVTGPEGLDDLLAESDFVVLAAPLTPDTESMINDRTLARFKPGSWLINVARGRLVDDRALLRALRDGPLGGAVLDAFREEPLPPNSPFYGLDNVIITPHTSWSSGRVLNRSVELFCDNLRRFAAGEPLLNVVDPVAGY